MRNELRLLTRELKNLLRHGDDDFLSSIPVSAQAAAEAAPLQPEAAPGAAQTAGKPRDEQLEQIRAEVQSCRKCPLGATRLNSAFGVGDSASPVMFIGEGPGYEEDHRGEPFVGKAGQLLDKIIEAITLSRRKVYIANIVKCHPMVNPANPEQRGNDRPPSDAEITACRPYLDRQIEIIKPSHIVALGSVAARELTGVPKSLTSLRGVVHEIQFPSGRSVRLVATYHPAALLRNPDWKKGAWDDMKLLMRDMGMEIPQSPRPAQ